MDAIFALLDNIVEQYGSQSIIGIGMAVQGTVNARDGVSTVFPGVSGWGKVPLQSIITERYGYPTKLWHDPDCIMVAERAFGAPAMADAPAALLIRMDQSIGMSILSNGRFHLEAGGKAGELVHMTIAPNGEPCSYYQSRGCLGNYVGGMGIVTRFIDAVNHNRPTRLAVENVQTLTYRDVVMAAHKGDPLSLELFRDMGEKMGQALSILYTLFDPELIVMYGDLC